MNLDKEVRDIIDRVFAQHGCQVITNGVIPTIKYYLRLVENPMVFLQKYTALLGSDDDRVKPVHLEHWLSIVSDLSEEN